MNEQVVRVADCVEAAVLQANRVPQSDCRLVGDRVIFEFIGPDAAELLRMHRSGELQVGSLDFAESLGAVKTRIFALRREGGLR